MSRRSAVASAVESAPELAVPPEDSARVERELAAFERLRAPAGGNFFVNRTYNMPRTALYNARFYVQVVLLGLPRLLMTCSVMLCIALLAQIGTAGMSRRDFDAPLPPWRQVLLAPLPWLARLQLFLWGYLYVKVTGTLAPRDVAPIVVSNHIGFMDPSFLYAYTHGTPVSASENGKLPLLGAILKAMQALMVTRDRSTPEKGVAATPPPMTTTERIRARALDPRYPRVLVFPEGTCTNGSAVISFKSGAFAAGVPVQPVAIRYPHTHFDPSWASAGPGLGPLLFTCMCQVYNRMEVEFLPVHAPSAAEQRDPQLFATNVQRQIAAALGAKPTQHGFEDIQLAAVAASQAYPVSRAVVEFTALRAALNIDAKAAALYLRRFIAADAHKTGRLSYEQFRDMLRHPAAAGATSAAAPDSPAAIGGGEDMLRRIFDLLDRNDDGGLDFRELLVGLAVINGRGVEGTTDALRLAFKAMDAGGTGAISRDQLVAALRRVWPDVSREALQAAWAEADADRDGRVTPDEFIAWALAHQEHVPLFRKTFLGFSSELELLAAAEGAAASSAGLLGAS